ncbi:hypothetical protein TSUD_188800 [Trifolium subterraneum]|uniref:DUF223 domain-containing protein n=1 Tax=Trifolium subterraneum TaxID=3900 RepID=A0A2Z6PMP1_TRISU|nr:hypothetical protein TSUD_188800 [Trifolium subterraneum]
MVYNEKDKLGVKFVDVADSDAAKYNLCIKVRVIRMWKVNVFGDPSDFSSLEMVLGDDKGGKSMQLLGSNLFICLSPSLRRARGKCECALFLIQEYIFAMHVIGMFFRFRVSLEVTDGRDTCVFGVFDADMSYMMEKSCAFFVARCKGKTVGPHPIEFDGLLGKKMLFDGPLKKVKIEKE